MCPGDVGHAALLSLCRILRPAQANALRGVLNGAEGHHLPGLRCLGRYVRRTNRSGDGSRGGGGGVDEGIGVGVGGVRYGVGVGVGVGVVGGAGVGVGIGAAFGENAVGVAVAAAAVLQHHHVYTSRSSMRAACFPPGTPRTTQAVC